MTFVPAYHQTQQQSSFCGAQILKPVQGGRIPGHKIKVELVDKFSKLESEMNN